MVLVQNALKPLARNDLFRYRRIKMLLEEPCKHDLNMVAATLSKKTRRMTNIWLELRAGTPLNLFVGKATPLFSDVKVC